MANNRFVRGHQIERLYPNTNKFELFARSVRDGWDAWGDEV
jgi:N6-adenosine-specific RNA methylase IME4